MKSVTQLPARTIPPRLLTTIIIVIAASGCTVSQGVSDSIGTLKIDQHMSNPESAALPIRSGDKVTISVKDPVEIGGKIAATFEMVVDEVKPASITGQAIVPGDYRRVDLEVELKNVNYIGVIGKTNFGVAPGSKKHLREISGVLLLFLVGAAL